MTLTCCEPVLRTTPSFRVQSFHADDCPVWAGAPLGPSRRAPRAAPERPPAAPVRSIFDPDYVDAHLDDDDDKRSSR